MVKLTNHIICIGEQVTDQFSNYLAMFLGSDIGKSCIMKSITFEGIIYSAIYRICSTSVSASVRPTEYNGTYF